MLGRSSAYDGREGELAMTITGLLVLEIRAAVRVGVRDPSPPRDGGAVAARQIVALTIAVIVATAGGIGGCTSLEQYSVHAAEQSCDALSVCTVYGPNGKYLSPCTYEGRQTVYPGDPRWPYTTPGVCDAVRDGRVVSTRDVK
jgi:hypothetical protein